MSIFLQKLREHKLCTYTVIVSIIILSTAVYIYVGISIIKLVSHNTRDVSLLGIEMLCESGPNFQDTAKKHVIMVNRHIDHMETKRFANELNAFFNKYSPKKGLEEALNTLKKAEGYTQEQQEEAAKAIWLAGEQVEQYRMKLIGFPKFGIDPHKHKYKIAPEKLVKDIKKALDQSQESFKWFKGHSALQNAVFLCENNRRTMLLLFLAKVGYKSGYKKVFDEFRMLEGQVIEEEQKLSNKVIGAEKVLIEHIIQNEQRRLNIMGHVEGGDMHKAYTLMWETIDTAYHERMSILTSASAKTINFGKGWERSILENPPLP